MTDGGSTVLGDQSYRVYSASNLPGASVVSGELSEPSRGSTPGPPELATLSLAVVLCVFGAGAVLITRRARLTAPQRRDGRPDPVQERLTLVVQIAVLDERLATGEISHVEHQAQRRLAKQRLQQIAGVLNRA